MKDSITRLKEKTKGKLGGSASSQRSRFPLESESESESVSGSGSRAIPAEATKLANDPNFVVEFAIGDPFPDLVPQDPNDGSQIRLAGVYFDENRRYLLKKAHFSRQDRRLFDVESGRVLMASHHEGKNPYESVDPLGYNESATGEWKSMTTVTSVDPRYPSFKIRPKTLSRHGTQYVDLIGDAEDEVMSVGKMGKTRSRSMRPHFVVGRGKEKGKGSKMVYKIVGDIVGRTLSIENSRGELVAVMAKTNKAMLKTAVFGSGSESTIDVAAGVDCSTILCIIFALGQVGAHYVKDCFGNFVQDPIQDAAVETAFGHATGGVLGDSGAAEELAEKVGLDNELDDVGNAVGDFVEGTGIGDFAEEAWDGVEDFAGDVANDAADVAGEVIGFFFDLFGGGGE